MGLPQASHLEMLAVAVCAATRSFTHSFSDCVASICKKMMSFIKVNTTSHFSFNNLPYGIFSTADNVGGLWFFFLFFFFFLLQLDGLRDISGMSETLRMTQGILQG